VIRAITALICLSFTTLLFAAPGSSLYVPGARIGDRTAAAEAYNEGLAERDKAWEYEKKASEYAQGERKAEKYRKQAHKHYENAIEEYKRALNIDNHLYQAHSSLGYALRKTGALQESVMAYENSLMINPNYPEAIEYLAETYLAMERFEMVKSSYAKLANAHPKYAQLLSQAIDTWLAAKPISSREMQQFAHWAKERKYASNSGRESADK
jgi:tetratricopeptide (TPR) repeat protein